MIRQFELLERVRNYDPSTDEDALNRAYVFAMKAHGAQTRASGDPYFSHPLEVAGILADMKLDYGTIITALLHDVVEDTEYTVEDIARVAGPEIARLVDGVTKLSRLELQSDHTKHAENFRKLVLALSEDIRVLLVKLADRLHNMQTLHFIKAPEKRRRIAHETLEIYAPLAERIGMQSLKDDLEEMAFQELNPDARASIIARLEFLRQQDMDVVGRIEVALRRLLEQSGIIAQVSGRQKRPYSIWRKMQRRNITFEQLSDVMAFRIIVDNIEECYRTLGLIHCHYRMVPGRFKDYISTPKPNGYQSIHTGVIGPEKQRIEIQIRTRAMHEVAELGVAAHWAYKQEVRTEGKQYMWVRHLLEILDHASTPEEFLENTKLEMFQDQVFCFTPKGDLIALPHGATPVDFAYSVHSGVGDTCVGAKINGRMMPLRTPLRNGDQVEILVSRNQTPNPTWEKFVVTGKARARIRRYIRSQQRQQYVDLGREILQRTFRQEGGTLTDKALDHILPNFKCGSVEDLYAEVGQGHHTGMEVFHAVYPGSRDQKAGKVVPLARMRKKAAGPRRDGVPIKGLIDGMAVHYAGCCHPLPGDRIVGIVSSGRGVTIHTIDCDQLENHVDEPERWLDVAWDDVTDTTDHVGRVDLVVANESGALGHLSTLIAKNGGNIHNLKITNRTADFFTMMIDIEVRDVKHLTHIIAALRASPSISSVDRARG